MSPTPALWHKTVSPSLITRSYCSIHLIISLAGMIISSEYRHMIAAQSSFWHNILKTLGKQAPSLRNFCFFIWVARKVLNVSQGRKISVKIVLLGAFLSSWTQMWNIVTACPAACVCKKSSWIFSEAYTSKHFLEIGESQMAKCSFKTKHDSRTLTGMRPSLKWAKLFFSSVSKTFCGTTMKRGRLTGSRKKVLSFIDEI